MRSKALNHIQRCPCPFNKDFLCTPHVSSTRVAVQRTQYGGPSLLGQGFVSKGRSLCQVADRVLTVGNSGIINAIILKILEKLTHLALATSNQRCQVIDSNLTPNLIRGEQKIISTLYLWSTLFFHKAPSTVPPPSPGEGRVEGEL